MVQFFRGSNRIFQSGNFTMLNQSPRTGLDARGTSSIYIKTAFVNLLQSYLNRDSEHIIQEEFFTQKTIYLLMQNFFSLLVFTVLCVVLFLWIIVVFFVLCLLYVALFLLILTFIFASYIIEYMTYILLNICEKFYVKNSYQVTST